MLPRPILPALTLIFLFACGPGKDSPKRHSTERERDSVLGASQLPGATGVRGALRAQDSATARNSRVDSTSNQP
jgi:hypothetical protein